MKPHELYSSSILRDIDRMMKPHRSMMQWIEKTNKLIRTGTLDYFQDIAGTHNTFKESYGIADALVGLSNSWNLPTQVNAWQSIAPQMEYWNEMVKPHLLGVSLLSSEMINQLSAIDTAYKQVANILRPMKPLSVQFDTFDFLSAAISDMDLDEDDEVAVEDGLTVIADSFAAFIAGAGTSVSSFELMLSELQDKIVAKYNRHKVIFPILIFLLGYYAEHVLDRLQQPKAELPSIEAKVTAPRKKKIVYDKVQTVRLPKKAAN